MWYLNGHELELHNLIVCSSNNMCYVRRCNILLLYFCLVKQLYIFECYSLSERVTKIEISTS